eukprot:TRINITY_DN1650_c0_g1_i1.p1 TRINITY_DN1650_c0_g1~~TRINITY_DN1650_c0_g1_i1.p1  ORF type:complete len:348 (-),score=61.93 TRINITY_DN1650_c0_g1_i1:98-1141(-)
MSAYCLTLSRRLTKFATEREALRNLGLDYFDIFFSPAAGPRYFVTAGFERVFLRTPITTPKYFVAASSGALRFTSLLCSKYTGVDLFAKFEHELCKFSISYKDTPQQLATKLRELFSGYTHDLVEQLLNDSQHRVCIFVSQVHDWIATTPRMGAAFAASLLGNFAHSGAQNLLYRRLCFYTGDKPPNTVIDSTKVEFYPLTHENFHTVLVASAAIPFRVASPRHMPGVGDGVFVDGGLGDYMMNVQVRKNALLLSHTSRVYRTWMDTLVPYRKLPDDDFEYVSVLHPRKEFVGSLADKRIPSRMDWDRYANRPELRYKLWQDCIQRSVEHFPRNLLDDALIELRNSR